MQNLRALGAEPPDPRASGGPPRAPQPPAAGGFAPRPPLQICGYAPAKGGSLSDSKLAAS